jgi:peptide/nickel transport system permease protein
MANRAMLTDARRDRWRWVVDNDLWYRFSHSPLAIASALLAGGLILASVLAPAIAPQNPFDLAEIDLLNSLLPPAWLVEGDARFVFGTDDQGRDVFSTILYGLRVSLLVGFVSVLLAMMIGVVAGLLSGYFGGWLDAIIMRIADVQLSFPAILVALLVDGIIRGVLPPGIHTRSAIFVLILAIGLSFWVHYARTVRGSTMVEKGKEYVHAARIIGISRCRILLRHILPNVIRPVLVIGTLNLAIAIIAEATLSFLGVGMPPTQPSLGTLIREGNDYLFSGAWWITIFPGAALVLLVLSVNLLGDWLRDAVNPRNL